jgi:hypothetical protein
MLGADADVAIANLELFEIHRTKISLHHAKADYSDPRYGSLAKRHDTRSA